MRIIAVIAAACIASPLSASVISDTAALDWNAGDYNPIRIGDEYIASKIFQPDFQFIDLKKFNQSLGTLTAVQFHYDLTLTAGSRFANKVESSYQLRTDTWANVVVIASDNVEYSEPYADKISITPRRNIGQFDILGSVDKFLGTGSDTFRMVADGGARSFTDVSQMEDKFCFPDPGEPCMADLSTLADVNARLTGTVTVEYDYIATVPLPAGLPLLLAGIGGLGLVARRKRKAG